MGSGGTRLVFAVVVLALFAAASAVGSGRSARPVRVEAPVEPEAHLVAYGGSRLLVAERSFASSPGAITRINLNGSIDRSFGRKGRVAMDAEDALVAAGGKILVSTTSNPGESAKESAARITRLLPDGRPDRSFGVAGHADIHFGADYGYAETAALAPNGDILVGGIRVNHEEDRGESDYSLGIARLKPDGSPDRGFGKNGVRILPRGGEVEVRDIALTPSGDVVILGGNEIESFLWKLNRDGSIDRHFGKDGFVEVRERRKVGGRLEELSYAPGVVVLPSGRLLLAASGFLYRGQGGRSRVVAIRLRPDGRQDHTYGNHGWAIAGNGIDWTLAEGLTLLPGGVLAVATSFEDQNSNEHREFGAIAFRSGGRLDNRFGRHAQCRARLPGRHEAAAITALDGRAVVLGGGYPGQWLLACR
jgi:uncharacterized delta-60 repeat protein